MGRRLILSGDDALRVCSFPPFEEIGRIDLRHAGALCAGNGLLFCADDSERMIWRLDGALRPTGLFPGGPGMTQMTLDAGRLLILCAEADSVLALDAESGAPVLLARAGLNPSGMVLDGSSGLLAVAGGESGEVILLDAVSLKTLERLPMPGPVCSAAFGAGLVHALCLSETLASVMVSAGSGGRRDMQLLTGMPGALLCSDGMLLAGVQDMLYWLSSDGEKILGRQDAPGRAGKMLFCGGQLLMLDALSETLWALPRFGARWRLLCDHVRDAVVTGE